MSNIKLKKKRTKPLEKDIQRKCVDFADHLGWWSRKWDSRHASGQPDYIFIYQENLIVFVEFKRPGEKPTALQIETIDELRSRGCSVYVIDNQDAFEQLFRRITQEQDLGI